MKMAIIYTTCANADEAKKIARQLVEKNIAACVNILSPCTSIYRWKGEIDEANEVPILIKTTMKLKDAALRIVVSLHSYETPAIEVWEGESLYIDYSQWLQENVKDLA